MSKENVEIARTAHSAWNDDDLDAFLTCVGPEIEWRTVSRLPEARTTYY